MIILVRRTGAMGDVVLTTPVVRRLARENPDARIIVQTAYPEIYENNPYATAERSAVIEHDREIVLDLAYEKTPRRHVVHSYMAAAFGEADTGFPIDWQQQMFDRRGAPPRYAPAGKPFVVVHGTGGNAWRNKIQRPAFWTEVHRLLQQAGFATISVGRSGDDGQGTIDARNMFSPVALRTLVRQAVCFVGSDSGPMHVAGTTGVPIAGLFTCTRPENYLPWRDGVLGKDCIGLTPALDCIGCLHDETPPVTSVGCRRGDYACVESAAAITAEAVLAAVLELTKGKRS